MSRNRVMVEIGAAGNVIRIFRFPKRALSYPPEKVKELPRGEATGLIRHQIWIRTGGQCEYGCGRSFTKHGDRFTRMHMHEKQARGKGIDPGEISLENSIGTCWICHDKVGHQDRQLHFGESNAGG